MEIITSKPNNVSVDTNGLLCDTYMQWVLDNNLPEESMDDLLMRLLEDKQTNKHLIDALQAFITLWDNLCVVTI